MNLYQHPDQCSLARKAPLEARGEVWTQLDRLLSRLARRNLTVVAGDFNCPLSSPPKNSSHCPSDMFDFVEITRKHHSGTVRAHDRTPTFVGPQGHSTIDFVLMPVAQMDSHCRNGRALADFPVASWRDTRDHLPIISSLPLSWKCWYNNKPRQVNTLPRTTQQVLRDVWQTKDSTWMELRAQLAVSVATIPPVITNVSHLAQTTLNACYHALKPLQKRVHLIVRP